MWKLISGDGCCNFCTCAAATFALKWRASITLLVAEFGEFCFCIDDVCVECFRALFLSSLASLKDKEWEDIRERGGEGRGGEKGDQNGMKSKEVPNKKALFVGMVWQSRNGVGECLDMAF
jgi:hypothetical protein